MIHLSDDAEQIVALGLAILGFLVGTGGVILAVSCFISREWIREDSEP